MFEIAASSSVFELRVREHFITGRFGLNRALPLLPYALDFAIALQSSLSSRPRKRRCHISGAPQFEAGARNILLVGPSKVRDVSIFHSDRVERFRSRSRERRRCGLVEEYVEERFLLWS